MLQNKICTLLSLVVVAGSLSWLVLPSTSLGVNCLSNTVAGTTSSSEPLKPSLFWLILLWVWYNGLIILLSCPTRWITIATKEFNCFFPQFFFLTDVISSEITPRVLRHVRSFLSSNIDSSVADVFESDPGSWFWLKMIEAIKDPYAVERLSEQLLHYLAIEHASDVEAYWFFWLLFHQTFKNQASVRSVNMLCS